MSGKLGILYIMVLLAMVMLSTSCRPLPLLVVEPSGPPEYRLGWEDGCDTGVSSVSGTLIKMVLGHRKRPEMSQSEFYNQGWSEGFHYCRFSKQQIRTEEGDFGL